jgi:hypothetical protein
MTLFAEVIGMAGQTPAQSTFATFIATVADPAASRRASLPRE